MSTVPDSLRNYYEEEARQGTRTRPPAGRRLALRDEFIGQLQAEGRRNVVDLGAGPGRDASGFLDAGISYVGLDLAHGNSVSAAERNVTVVHGSLTAPPLRPASFDAGWSMSTLMHFPEAHVPTALAAMVTVLAPGAPLVVAQWGGSLGDLVDDTELPGQQRLFSLRSFERNCELIAAAGALEHKDLWHDVGPEGWEYHVVRVRLPD